MEYVVTEGRRGQSMIQVGNRLVGVCEPFGVRRWVFYAIDGTMMLVEDFPDAVNTLVDLDRNLWI
ncbi:hypothetical protein ACIGO9_28555 [Nocardia asteroides]|uniref:hypothetical protein n=1 Tax=Nocardia asteroides TaxID=1824 RepID=UPI0037C640E0